MNKIATKLEQNHMNEKKRGGDEHLNSNSGYAVPWG